MKKIINICMMIGVFLAVSCNDLSETAYNQLSPDGIFQSVENLQSGINGGYMLLAAEQGYGRKIMLTLMIRSDMVTTGDPSTAARRFAVDEMNMGANNDMVNTFWPQLYQILASANGVINGSSSVDDDQEKIDEVTAQAYFLRAHVHYVLVRLFGEIIYMDGASLTRDEAISIEQSPVEETYAGIIADLEFCIENLPANGSASHLDVSYPSRETAMGYLAQVYLTIGEWALAQQYAEEVINSGAYSLEADFNDIFDPLVVSEELMFSLDMVPNDAASTNGETNNSTDQITSVTGPRGDERFAGSNTSSFGWSAIVPAITVYDSWDGRDYRKAVSLDTAIVHTYTDASGTEITDPSYYFTNWGTIAQNVPRPHVAKYFRQVGQSGAVTGASLRDSNCRYSMLRLAEMYLIAAEAINELEGPTAQAIEYVNIIRRRAQNGDISDGNLNYPASNFPALVSSDESADYESFLNTIMEERRLELAFEGGRWYDIVRRQMGDVFTGAEPNLEVQPFDPARDYLFPKYNVDLDQLDGLTDNLGY